jgi:hypothetical protein
MFSKLSLAAFVFVSLATIGLGACGGSSNDQIATAPKDRVASGPEDKIISRKRYVEVNEACYKVSRDSVPRCISNHFQSKVNDYCTEKRMSSDGAECNELQRKVTQKVVENSLYNLSDAIERRDAAKAAIEAIDSGNAAKIQEAIKAREATEAQIADREANRQ